MGNTNRGFISVVMLFLLLLFLTVCVSTWITISNYKGITQKKQLYVKEFWLLQGALLCSIEYVSGFIKSQEFEKTNFQEIIDPWPLNSRGDFKVKIISQNIRDGVLLNVKLFNKEKLKRVLSCIVGKNDKGKIVIFKWNECKKTT